jgi:hypothetical protein
VPERIVEIIEVIVETREDLERVKAREAADAVSVHIGRGVGDECS